MELEFGEYFHNYLKSYLDDQLNSNNNGIIINSI